MEFISMLFNLMKALFNRVISFFRPSLKEHEEDKAKLFSYLRELKNCVPGKCGFKVDDTLFWIYYVGKDRIRFTDREKREFGNLVIDHIGLIQLNIDYTVQRYRTRLETAVLAKRSALEFLVVNYGKFPAKNSTLKSELKKVNIKESIKKLDKIIALYWDEDLCSTSSEPPTDIEDLGASDLPNSHQWWWNGRSEKSHFTD